MKLFTFHSTIVVEIDLDIFFFRSKSKEGSGSWGSPERGDIRVGRTTLCQSSWNLRCSCLPDFRLDRHC